MADNAKIEEQRNKSLLMLGTMLDYLGLDADLAVEEKNGRMQIKMSSSDAGRIIGRRGQTLESLQLLLNRMMFAGDEEASMITLDIDGYSKGNVVTGSGDRRSRGGRRDDRGGRGERGERGERRGGRRGDGEDRRRREDSISEEELRQLALDRAKEVKRWGQPVELSKMNAHDRRIIHINLQDDPEIETRSEGDGSMKSVIISLKNSEN